MSEPNGNPSGRKSATSAMSLTLDHGVQLTGLRASLIWQTNGNTQRWTGPILRPPDHNAGIEKSNFAIATPPFGVMPRDIADLARSSSSRVFAGGLRAEWSLRQTDANTAEIHCALTNEGTDPVQLDSLTIAEAELDLGGPTGRWSTYRNGFQSWSGTYTLRADERDRDLVIDLARRATTDPASSSPSEPGQVRSDLLTAVSDLASGVTLGAAFLDGARSFCTISCFARPNGPSGTSGTISFDTTDLPQLAHGEAWWAPPVRLRTGTTAWDVLTASVSDTGDAMAARVDSASLTGWCSWYEYFTKVTEADVLSNLECLDDHKHRAQIDYVQVDDGFQTAIGDWQSINAKFPRGMAPLAADIAATGRRAGIWLAPFLVDPGSQLAAAHPDWLLRGRRGQPVAALWNPAWRKTRMIHALDVTHPEVVEWLEATISTVVHDWGYDILKLDFLYAAALMGERHDPTVTRAAATRSALEAIRRAAGDEAFLIGCGCPLGPAVGIVDSMRIGADVAPWWSNPVSRHLQADRHGIGTVHAIRNIITRQPFHRRLWVNDPDCLMVRRHDTALTENEIATLADAIGIGDALVVLSDDLTKLDERAWTDIERVLERRGTNPVVTDLFERFSPTTIASSVQPEHPGAPAETDWVLLNIGDDPIDVDSPDGADSHREWPPQGAGQPRPGVEHLAGRSSLRLRGPRTRP